MFFKLDVDLTDYKSRLLIMNYAIKCADISNATKIPHLSMHWTALIMEEFFHQGDEEKRLGLQVSPLMDRKSTVVSKCQLGFIDFIVMPLYQNWDIYLNTSDTFPGLKNLNQNREYWKK
jgi:hypothetical protein